MYQMLLQWLQRRVFHIHHWVDVECIPVYVNKNGQRPGYYRYVQRCESCHHMRHYDV